MDRKNHYVYTLCCTNPIDTRIFYVGKRSCDVNIWNDGDYMSSNEEVTRLVRKGLKFEKEAGFVFGTATEALSFERKFQDTFDCHRAPHYFNSEKNTFLWKEELLDKTVRVSEDELIELTKIKVAHSKIDFTLKDILWRNDESYRSKIRLLSKLKNMSPVVVQKMAIDLFVHHVFREFISATDHPTGKDLPPYDEMSKAIRTSEVVKISNEILHRIGVQEPELFSTLSTGTPAFLLPEVELHATT